MWRIFFNVNIFFKCKLNINVSISNDSLYLCSMLLKASLLLPHLFCSVDFELIRLIEFQNKTNIDAFWIHLRSRNIDFLDIDLLDTYLEAMLRYRYPQSVSWLGTDI